MKPPFVLRTSAGKNDERQMTNGKRQKAKRVGAWCVFGPVTQEQGRLICIGKKCLSRRNLERAQVGRFFCESYETEASEVNQIHGSSEAASDCKRIDLQALDLPKVIFCQSPKIRDGPGF